MTGIVFFRSADRERVATFYRDRLGFERWLEQDGCVVPRRDNLLLGFCDGDEPETDGTVTVVHETWEEVDTHYEDLADVVRDEPGANERLRIYQFFADDPESRAVEVQAFDHETPPIG